MEYDFYSIFVQHPCTRPLFRGTFARNEIAREKPLPGIYIVNTDPREETGEHWTLFFISSNREITYFDSLGTVPLHAEMYDFIGEADHFFFNKKRLQAANTTTCGLYCIYVGARLACGHAMSDITAKFSSKYLLANDRLIPVLVRKEYRVRRSLTCCTPNKAK